MPCKIFRSLLRIYTHLYSNVSLRKRKIKLSGKLIGKRLNLSPGVKSTGEASEEETIRTKSFFNDFLRFFMFLPFLTFIQKLIMIRNNLEHPFHPPRKISNQAPGQPLLAPKSIPSSPAGMQPSSSTKQIHQPQPKITFSSGSLPPPKAEPIRVT